MLCGNNLQNVYWKAYNCISTELQLFLWLGAQNNFLRAFWLYCVTHGYEIVHHACRATACPIALVLCSHRAGLPVPNQFRCSVDNFLLFKACTCALCALLHSPPGSCRLEISKFMHVMLKMEKQYFRRELCFHSVTCWPCLTWWFTLGEFFRQESFNGPTYHMSVTAQSNLRAHKLNSFEMKLSLETDTKSPTVHRLLFLCQSLYWSWSKPPEMRKVWMPGPKSRPFCPSDLFLLCCCCALVANVDIAYLY